MTITSITCTYNAAGVLRPTLDSVISQTYGKIEHIIIDGNSTDNTVSMASQYQEESRQRNTGHTVRIVSEPDKGLYDAMNKGLAMASGTYLCFLNAGDTLACADTIKHIAGSAMQATKPYSVIYGETDVVDSGGRFIRHRRLRVPGRLTWRSFRHGMLVCHQAFYANTEIARQTPYDLRYRISADVDWCIRIMREGERRGMQTHNMERVVCHYLAGGMSIKNHRASLLDRFNIMRRHYGTPDTIMMHAWFVLRGVLKR